MYQKLFPLSLWAPPNSRARMCSDMPRWATTASLLPYLTLCGTSAHRTQWGPYKVKTPPRATLEMATSRRDKSQEGSTWAEKPGRPTLTFYFKLTSLYKVQALVEVDGSHPVYQHWRGKPEPSSVGTHFHVVSVISDLWTATHQRTTSAIALNHNQNQPLVYLPSAWGQGGLIVQPGMSTSTWSSSHPSSHFILGVPRRKASSWAMPYGGIVRELLGQQHVTGTKPPSLPWADTMLSYVTPFHYLRLTVFLSPCRGSFQSRWELPIPVFKKPYVGRSAPCLW